MAAFAVFRAPEERCVLWGHRLGLIIPCVVDAKEDSYRCRSGLAGLLLSLAAALLIAGPAAGQQTIKITGDRLSGVVLPVEPLFGDIGLTALRGWMWTVGDTKRLVLEGDVKVNIAGHAFQSNGAVLWLNRLPSEDGVINQIAVFFDRVDNPIHRAGMGAAGDRLLVTGSTRGGVSLRAALVEDRRPQNHPLLNQGEARMAMHVRRVIGEEQQLHRQPQIDRPEAKREFIPQPGGTVQRQDWELSVEIELPEVRTQPWLRDPHAMVYFSAESIEIVPGEEENTITAIGSIVVEYFAENRGEEFGQMTLAADRCVIFTEPGSLRDMAAWEMEASQIRGIYLEGNVAASANEDEYVVRSPRMYYDFATGRAIMVDAILRTYARGGRLPIYARATEMRQVAENQWDTRTVRVSTSEFYTGHLALGSDRMTVTRRPVAGGQASEGVERETYLEAKGITMRAGGTPFFYWPHFSGTIKNIPLKSIEVGGGDNDGLRIETTWDLFSLLSSERIEGVNAALSIDGFTDRGAGVGLEFDYDLTVGAGDVELYGMYDDGVDITSSGQEVDQDDEIRGIALWEHQSRLSQYWTMQAQLSYISDETFISARREDDFRERREYETSLYLKRQKDRAALTFLAKYDLNDFISNDYLLASTQYKVDKLPEITYRRYGDSWFRDRMTYSTETRLTRMRMAFERSTSRELGVPSRGFGLRPDDQISDALRATGLESKYVTRFDSRHELAWPTQWGIFNLTPFVVGRLTGYDDDFEQYSQDADDFRVFGSIGVRVNTQFQRVDNSVESRLFDLHRVRHIIEPSMTAWFSHADVSEDDLPVYDLEVESLGTCAAVRVGVRNTWQTQRGGPGRWNSVNFLTADTNLVLNSRDANEESPIAQFFDYRPEYSQFGHHLQQGVLWLVSDLKKIPPNVLSLCRDPNNTLYLSVVNSWEIQIKTQKGKLDLPIPRKQLIEHSVEHGLALLPVMDTHIDALDEIGEHHADPFDRLLIAQAKAEKLTLLSVDEKIHRYKDQINVVWNESN